jgi:hypothetical protein
MVMCIYLHYLAKKNIISKGMSEMTKEFLERILRTTMFTVGT